MRVLLVNKFHWNKGGSETYYFELGKMLKKHGHEVAYFSTLDEKNIETKDKEYYVNNFDTNSKNVFKAFDTIYSSKNKNEMLKAIEGYKPDIVHVNLFQRHLTYSIVEACKEKNIPVVYTAHDLQAVCPASAMLCNGVICNKCLNNSKYNCFKNKCVKNSKLKSLLASIEASKYKKKKVYDLFDAIISPSRFVANILKQDGIKARIEILHNFVDISNFNGDNNKDKNYAFYFGRLSKEKGIINLIEAFSLQSSGELYIAGDGPEKDNILNYIKEKKLENRIKLLGFLNQNSIKEYISNCSFVVVPSIWYENCPYSILETLSIGKPIIGSKIGGIPELIKNEKNGFLYEYNDIESLSKLIEKMFKDKVLRNKMGKYSRLLAEKNYNIENYYINIYNLYRELVGEKENVSKINEQSNNKN